MKHEVFLSAIYLCVIFFISSNFLLATGLESFPLTRQHINLKEQNSNMSNNKQSYYINSSGVIIIDASKYDKSTSFSDGLAAVFSKDRGWGFIDKEGLEVIPLQHELVGNFSEGLAPMKVDQKWGFIDKKGYLVIKPKYNVVYSFSEGVAVVENGEEVFFIDKNDKVLATRNLNEISFNNNDKAIFSEGLLAAYDYASSKVGFVDKSGKFAIEPKFDEVGEFSEGLARVTVVQGEEKVGFINHDGRFVISPKFNTDYNFRSNSTNFSEGLASLTEGGRPSITNKSKFSYLDTNGNIVLSTNFSYAGPFFGGLASVYDTEKDKCGFIDKSGALVIHLQYDSVNDFSEGLALVSLHDK